ncbi:hypothetical protein CIPAW_07G113600 [Carya illinoinensis]|uniref:Uncharacterized protein n=1 Tax=Carya illinoinensis TaxID=32201 RepID=A0A8T1Q1Y1_CARIL|nr:hypothetical protein CIPAW_07G113600 [Carya illinoinensis]
MSSAGMPWALHFAFLAFLSIGLSNSTTSFFRTFSTSTSFIESTNEVEVRVRVRDIVNLRLWTFLCAMLNPFGLVLQQVPTTLELKGGILQ